MLDVDSNVKALIFDCDGTLAHSMPLHIQAWGKTLAQYGINCDLKFIETLAGMPTRELLKVFNRKFGYQVEEESFIAAKEKYVFSGLKSVAPIVPVVELVKKYYKKLPMSVASGGTRKHVNLTLKTIGLENFFDVIVTADDLVKPKPSPEIFLYAAECMSVEPKYCQVFEDGDLGLQAAREAGMIATDVRPAIYEWYQAKSKELS